jgi:hypothetical protein
MHIYAYIYVCIYIYVYMYVAAEVIAAEYDIVLTTFDVLSKEWAVASPSPGSARWYKLLV